jgi:hypothetical protein
MYATIVMNNERWCPTPLEILTVIVFFIGGLITFILSIIVGIVTFVIYASESEWWQKPICDK